MRSGNLPALLLSALLWGAPSLVPSHAQDANDGRLNDRTLSVCLNDNVPPYSMHHDNIGIGFDVAVAEALAKRLGRGLSVQWFESKLDEGSSAAIEANALLSDGRCALVGGYPLIKDALGKPGLESARLPDFEGARPSDRRRQVTLGTLLPTKPYHFAALTVVLAGTATARQITSLADLDGVKLGIEGGTLGDAILMSFDDGRFIRQITHLVPGRGQLLPGLESGDYAATLIPVHRFDAYRADHPDTKIRASGYYLPIGFNMAFVGLTSEEPLIVRANAALDDILKSGELASLARTARMTYLPPQEPYILDHISLHGLGKWLVLIRVDARREESTIRSVGEIETLHRDQVQLQHPRSLGSARVDWPYTVWLRVRTSLADGEDVAQGAVAVAEKGRGDYPQGSVVQLVRTEVMIKQQKGFNPTTRDWEFFAIDVSQDGGKIYQSGFENVNNRFGQNCFACHDFA